MIDTPARIPVASSHSVSVKLKLKFILLVGNERLSQRVSDTTTIHKGSSEMMLNFAPKLGSKK